MYWDIALRALRKIDGCSVRFDQIAPELWSLDSPTFFYRCGDDYDKSILLGDRSGRILPPDFSEELKKNRDVGLFVTQFCEQAANFEAAASVDLRRNKEFMLAAVAKNPICLYAAVGSISQDFELAVAAFTP